MNLKSLKKEEAKIQKKLQNYKNKILELISSQYDYTKNLSVGYAVKLSELNGKSLSVYDNLFQIQIKNFVKLIERATSFNSLYICIRDYKDIMWEKYRILTHPKFNEILEKIRKEIE